VSPHNSIAEVYLRLKKFRYSDPASVSNSIILLHMGIHTRGICPHIHCSTCSSCLNLFGLQLWAQHVAQKPMIQFQPRLRYPIPLSVELLRIVLSLNTSLDTLSPIWGNSDSSLLSKKMNYKGAKAGATFVGVWPTLRSSALSSLRRLKRVFRTSSRHHLPEWPPLAES
jgi:hypothetical protein